MYAECHSAECKKPNVLAPQTDNKELQLFIMNVSDLIVLKYLRNASNKFINPFQAIMKAKKTFQKFRLKSSVFN